MASCHKIFMQFENRRVPGLKDKLKAEGWAHYKVEKGETIMCRWVISHNNNASTKNHERRFNECIARYMRNRDAMLEVERYDKIIDKEFERKVLSRGVPVVDKTSLRQIMAENRRKMDEMGLKFVRADRGKNAWKS